MSGSKYGATVLALGLLTGACGSDPPPPPKNPSPAEVRDFYGIGEGSCWLYQYTSNGSSLTRLISAAGPNTTSIATRTVYSLTFQRQQGAGLPDEWLLDTESDSEMRLLRSTSGPSAAERVVSRYESAAEAPLFAKLEFDADDVIGFELGTRFETDSMPNDSNGDPKALERHTWIVEEDDQSVFLPTTFAADEMGTAYKLQYRLAIDGATSIGTYSIVPGFGFAAFTNFAGELHQICDARVCDASGNCTGSPCGELVCQ